MDQASSLFSPASAQAPAEALSDGASTNRLGLTWAALHDAADTVARLSGRVPTAMSPEIRNFPAAIREAGGWRLNLAEQGVSDLAAMMTPGLAALLQISARGDDAPAAAEALWQEFVLARDGLLHLLPLTRQP